MDFTIFCIKESKMSTTRVVSASPKLGCKNQNQNPLLFLSYDLKFTLKLVHDYAKWLIRELIHLVWLSKRLNNLIARHKTNCTNKSISTVLNFIGLKSVTYIVCCWGASQLGGSLLGIPPGYKANKLKESLSYPLDIIRTLV